jgi:hypothetical protein
MQRELVKVEIVEEGDDRFLVQVFADGSEVRLPIVEQSTKKKRTSAKIAWYWDLKTGRRRFF